MKDKKYNGWTNYETWAVNLWVGNDPNTENMARELAVRARTLAPRNDAVTRGVWTETECVKYMLADSLKDWVGDWTREEISPECQASLTSDLVGAALSEVDWQEIAEGYLEVIA